MNKEIREQINISMFIIKWNINSDWGVAYNRIFPESNMIFETQIGYIILK